MFLLYSILQLDFGAAVSAGVVQRLLSLLLLLVVLLFLLLLLLLLVFPVLAYDNKWHVLAAAAVGGVPCTAVAAAAA